VLEELRIAGLGVIDEAVLPLGPGLTVLTGETGAGKTMVVTALMLLFGERADTARIRPGANQASVDGRLRVADAGGELADRVADAGGELDEDGTLLLRRVVSTGRSRAFVGGAPVPVGVLGQLAERLLAVHGQSDQLRLARPTEQRASLDRFAGVDLDPYRVAFERWRLASARLAERTERARELRREADLIEHGLAEIGKVVPLRGEDVELDAEARRLAHVDGLRLAARAAHDHLLGDPDDPAGEAADVASLLGLAVRALAQQVGADGDLDELATRIGELAATATDIGAELADYRDRLDADPARLAEVEARRAILGGLTRRYGENIDAVLEWAESGQRRLVELDVSDEALAALAVARDTAAQACAELAADVTAQRVAAAERLATAVTAELAGLAMASSRIMIDVRSRPVATGLPALSIAGTDVGAGPDGVDDVEILLRSHPDAPALPLGRGASGGELSRVMLAIEVCLAGTDPVPTLVFDEVDAGVGGRAAVEVGRRLAALARDRQVIVVTHLAQVAAFADRHVVIDKPGATDGAGVNRSNVRLVDEQQRLVELARMLAGSDSVTAREHAAELVASAAAERASARTGAVPRSRSKKSISKKSISQR
jgi:DNA repair protein RecN (Recombination protein N)